MYARKGNLKYLRAGTRVFGARIVGRRVVVAEGVVQSTPSHVRLDGDEVFVGRPESATARAIRAYEAVFFGKDMVQIGRTRTAAIQIAHRAARRRVALAEKALLAATSAAGLLERAWIEEKGANRNAAKRSRRKPVAAEIDDEETA